MAGKYSRELSAKVFAGQRRLIELGYRQGGAAGYELRRMLVDVIVNIERLGGVVDRDREADLLTVNGEFSALLVLARCRNTEAGHHRWLIRFDAGLVPDITLAVRMAPGNREILDYYLLPQADIRPAKLRMGRKTAWVWIAFASMT